ncbi:hypothetical protein NM688_g8332 [Phlebia brevispora]|uniref:Uncharacterized protein n=1 Tax=Phlebia brevispora TaxID=194682 RepID=A0ACC1RU29_9APHY|nr:hypothetical protein NM688_g8332 [Phlebia brevispora]
MDRSGGTDFASRRRTLDVPAKPESGLAEWTSKIKELQRQVDADEEAETKRLEEEIAASRMARMRRSSGRGSSTDLSKTDVAAALKEPQGGSPAVADIPRSADERRQNQDDALKKLTSDAVNTRAAADYNSYIASKSMKATAAAAPMSLAAFIGGKATGPRLNKHAPQPDAHDPTQFEQRTIKGPHPIFGRGGIAMPGMVGKVRGVAESHEDIPSPRGGDIYSKSSVPSETFTVKSVVQKVELQRQPTTTQPGAIRSDSPRQRTFSTPAGPTIARTTFGVSSSSIEPKPQLQASSRPISYSPSPAVTTVKGPSRPSTPKEQPSANNHVFPARANTVSPHPRSPVIRSPSPPKTPTLGSSPGLAKPIQPSPKPLLQGPQIPLSQNSSPAFLRPSAAKEPTPSISRLQGRGFVQSMVRASSQLESSSTPSSPSMNDNAPSRKASVLDRWNHGNGAAPVIAPKPLPLRKVRTVEHSMQSTTGSSTPVQVYPTYTPPPPKPEKPDSLFRRTTEARTARRLLRGEP